MFSFLAVLCAGNLVVTFCRSGIPYDLTGFVSRVELRPEKRPGVDDVCLVSVKDRVVHLDTPVGRRLYPGDLLDKPAWTTSIKTPTEEIELGMSADFRGFAFLTPLIVLLGWLLLLRRAKEPAVPTSPAPDGE